MQPPLFTRDGPLKTEKLTHIKKIFDVMVNLKNDGKTNAINIENNQTLKSSS